MLAELCLKRCRTTTAGCGEHVDEDCDDGDDDDQGEGGEDKGRWFSKPLSVNAAKSNTFMLHPLKF